MMILPPLFTFVPRTSQPSRQGVITAAKRGGGSNKQRGGSTQRGAKATPPGGNKGRRKKSSPKGRSTPGGDRGGRAGGRGGGRAGRGGRGGTQKSAPKPNPFVTAPCSFETTDVLETSGTTLTPWWSTFVGHTEGVWCGMHAAFNLQSAKAEQVWLDDDRVKHFELHTRVIEEGAVEDGQSVLRRNTVRGITAEACCSAALQDANVDTTSLHESDDGLLHFDGGSYSCSPLSIGTEAFVEAPVELDDKAIFGDPGQIDLSSVANLQRLESVPEDEELGGQDDRGRESEEDSDEEVDESWRDVARDEMIEQSEMRDKKTVTVEHCIAIGGSERIRMQMLLQTDGGHDSELDVEVLRLAMYREHWLGTTSPDDDTSVKTGQMESVSTTRRASPTDLVGDWHTLDISAAVVQIEDQSTTDEDDADDASILPRMMKESEIEKVYFSRETAQQCKAGKLKPNESGISWWLPHGVTVSLIMQPSKLQLAQGADVSVIVGGDLHIRTTWQSSPKFLAVMETEYDARGTLVEARSSTLVPAVNDIPSMNVSAYAGLQD